MGQSPASHVRRKPALPAAPNSFRLAGHTYLQAPDLAQNSQQNQIQERFPKPPIICNAGYALHELSRNQPWNNTGLPFNLSNLICGSEGTLAFISQATVNLVPVPKYSIFVPVHFQSLDEALQAVPFAVKTNASAVELLDEYLIKLISQNIEQRRNSYWIKGKPNALLLVEFCLLNLQLSYQ